MTEADPADRYRFPFGDPSTPRPPRRPAGACKAFILGVYPSAIHVRWDLPTWAHTEHRRAVGALAIADEPTVFWDGDDDHALVEAWKERVGFRDGNGPGEWGHVRGVGNGTSGRPVRDGVLDVLGVDVADTWFTDAINEFYVKRGGAKTRQQGDVLDAVYAPFAASVGLPAANLPARPTPSALVRLAIAEHRDRLRQELVDANSPVVVTLGEEARQVLAGIADSVTGPPLATLTRTTMVETSYGEPGTVTVGGCEAVCFAAAHPGNRDMFWRGLHDAWQQRRRNSPVAITR
jgi:hypothetical protein